VEHYFSSFLQKEAIENVVKNLIMLDIQSLENPLKKLALFIAEMSKIIIIIIITAKVNFEK
jgi:hypothetical protein